MKYKNILKVSLAALLGLTALSGCVNKEWNEITDLNLARCLVPGNLAARVDATMGDVVTFGWDVNKDAGGYELAVYTDEAMTDLENSWALEPGEVPYTTRLTADKTYWFTVQAYKVDADGAKVPGTESKVSVYDGSFKTYAVKDNLFLEVKGRTTSSVSLAWSKDVDDFAEVTDLRAVPVKGGQTVKKELSGTEASAAAATIDGLDPSTEYQITLFYMSASRGTVDTWTKAEQGSAVTITRSLPAVNTICLTTRRVTPWARPSRPPTSPSSASFPPMVKGRRFPVPSTFPVSWRTAVPSGWRT